MSNENEELANRFRELRAKTGLSQKDFALSIGLSHTVIAEIERGSREPSRKVMVSIAQKYKVSLDWLLLGIGVLESDARILNKKEREIEELKKSISEMETTIRKLEVENKEMASELMERMRQLIKIQQEKLSDS